MKTPELKPCPFCGNEEISISVNTVKVTLWCVRCGCRITRGGKKPYKSIGNCRRFIQPLAVEAWNRRINNGTGNL